MRRLAIVASHPVQYHAPLYRALAEQCDLTVFFCHQQSAEEQGRAGFGEAFDWDVPLVDGYHFEWLTNVAANPGVDRFSGCDTPGIRERLDSGRFDACLVNGWYLKSYLQAIRACRALGIRVMVRGDSHLKVQTSPLKRAAKYLPYRWMLKRIDAHLFVGEANREYLRHYGVSDGQLFFAPHFVENDRFASVAAGAHQSGQSAALRATWGAGRSDTLCLFAGKLIESKRVQDLISALARASRENGSIKGVIVGSGPDLRALRSLADKERAPVVFSGFSNQRQMPVCYGAADCLVLPSASESWGLVVNEAMATGLPAIVSDRVGCAPDLIEERETGLTYPSGDVGALADRLLAMQQLLTANRDVIGRNVGRRIERYSCANAVAGILEAMEAGVATALVAPAAAEKRHA